MNEYKQEFDKLKSGSSFRDQQWFGKRRDLVEEYSWAVPNEEALVYLSEFDNVIEIGAGNGYWADCINRNGGKVMPYDIDPPENAWTHVEREDVNNMSKDCFEYPVLMVWPPLDNDMSVDVISNEPPHILYVGEPEGGCTATDEFFSILDREYGLVGKIDLPSYVGIHDDLYHYIRKV